MYNNSKLTIQFDDLKKERSFPEDDIFSIQNNLKITAIKIASFYLEDEFKRNPILQMIVVKKDNRYKTLDDDWIFRHFLYNYSKPSNLILIPYDTRVTDSILFQIRDKDLNFLEKHNFVKITMNIKELFLPEAEKFDLNKRYVDFVNGYIKYIGSLEVLYVYNNPLGKFVKEFVESEEGKKKIQETVMKTVMKRWYPAFNEED